MNREDILKEMSRVAETLEVRDEDIVKIVVSRDMWDEVRENIDDEDVMENETPNTIVLNGIQIRVDDFLPEKSWWPFRRKDLQSYKDIFKMDANYIQ